MKWQSPRCVHGSQILNIEFEFVDIYRFLSINATRGAIRSMSVSLQLVERMPKRQSTVASRGTFPHSSLFAPRRKASGSLPLAFAVRRAPFRYPITAYKKYSRIKNIHLFNFILHNFNKRMSWYILRFMASLTLV